MTRPQPSQPLNKDLAGYCGNVQQNIVWEHEAGDKEAAAHKNTQRHARTQAHELQRTHEDSTRTQRPGSEQASV